jgi:tetratricopeptide (TPR) repeat protein
MGKLSQQVGALNDADRLRSLIDECERALASLGPASAQQLLLNANEAHHRLDALQAAGADVRGEAARLSTVDDRIVRHAADIVKALGGREALVELRQQTAPGTAERFWLLDQELDMRRRRLLQRVGVGAIVLLVVLAIGYIARPILFPPDPAGDAVAAADRALQVKDVPGAVAAIDTGLKVVPTSTELLIWKGILAEKAGDTAASESAFEAGLSYAASDREFYLQRALAYIRMGDYQHTITDTNTVLQKYPDSAEAYYIRATGYEGIGDRLQAIADLEKSAQLAQQQGNDPLYAQARLRMGTLMQAGAGQ